MRKGLKILTVLGLSSILSTNALADNTVNASQDNKNLYLGFEGGISEPALKGFTHKSSGSKFTLKRSPMYTGLVGYKVYPGMAVELSFTHQPTYKLGIKLSEETNFATDKTKAQSNVYMVNFVYDLADFQNFTPYVVVGAGMAQVRVKEVAIKGSHPMLGEFNYFKSSRKASNVFAWQAGLGISKEVAPGLKLNASAKLQVLHNVKIKYESFDKEATMKNYMSGKMQHAYKPGVIKKTIGAGEFGLGFTYDLPF